MTPRPAPLAEKPDKHAEMLGLYETLALAGTDVRVSAETVFHCRNMVGEQHLTALRTARSAAERVLAAITEYEAGR